MCRLIPESLPVLFHTDARWTDLYHFHDLGYKRKVWQATETELHVSSEGGIKYREKKGKNIDTKKSRLAGWSTRGPILNALPKPPTRCSHFQG